MTEYGKISTPRGHVLFCDDVRHEITQKLIYIGVYPDGLTIHGEFPARLPTFCILVTYVERIGETEGPVRIVVESSWDEDGKPFSELDFPPDEFRSQPIPGGIIDPQHVATLIFRMNDVIIKEPGELTVYAEVGGRRFRFGRLPITAAIEQVSVQPSDSEMLQ